MRGLRARVRKTKSGPRPWVASFLGVTDVGDAWMPTLMQLLLEHHGSSWRVHDFLGPKALHDGTFLGEPTTLQEDMARLKVLMSRDLLYGKDVPFDKPFIERFRFHGCKATMVTYMQHFGVKAKTVRHAGAWAKQADSMPDLYLRESQLLVLKAQEDCLARLRAGHAVTPLEGLPLSGAVPSFEELKPGESINGPPEAGEKGAKAMAFPLLESKDLLAEFRDDVDEQDAILESETKLSVDEASVLDMVESPRLDDSSSEGDPEEMDQDLWEFFLVNKTGRGKVHKASMEGMDKPRCGVYSSGFQPLLAEEAMLGDSSLCIRCFGAADPEATCETMCSYRRTVGGVSRRCGRRCILNCSPVGAVPDKRVHTCLLHSATQMVEDLS